MSRPGFVGANLQTWKTPRELYEKLDAEFHFDTDPCPADPIVNGMLSTWGKSVFINPPYREIPQWITRGLGYWRMGSTVVALLPVRTSTAWFHDLVLPTAEIRWIRGRLRFEGHPGDGRPTFDSMIALWRGR